MKVTNNCQPIRPLFKGYKDFDGKRIKSSDYRMWKDNIFVKDVVETKNATFKKLTILDSRTNKPIAQKVKEVVKNVSFKGYKSILKTLWRAGLLPSVRNGLYGGELTQRSLSLEHLVARTKGGRSELCNLALATKRNNELRNARPIKEFLTKEMFDAYCKQFEGVQVGSFNGHKYVEGLKQTLKGVFDA